MFAARELSFRLLRFLVPPCYRPTLILSTTLPPHILYCTIIHHVFTSRCFVKAKTLPVDMEGQLAAVHGEKRDGAKGPGVETLTATPNTLSSRLHEVAQRGSTNTECSDLYANLDITLGEPANEAAIRTAQVWASVEDEDDVVESGCGGGYYGASGWDGPGRGGSWQEKERGQQ